MILFSGLPAGPRPFGAIVGSPCAGPSTLRRRAPLGGLERSGCSVHPQDGLKLGNGAVGGVEVDPANAKAASGRNVLLRIIHEEHLRGRQDEPLEGDPEDARIRLPDPLLGGADDVSRR